MTAENPELTESWRGLLSRYNAVAHELERELHAEYGLTMSEYEALDRLVEFDGCKARVQDLVGDMYLSQSALSRTIARLEKRGLVTRAICETDRRGIFVAATQDGRALQAAARPTYLNVLARHLPSAS